MDTNSVSSVQQKTPTKRSKPSRKTKNQIKVVYISNPMKVKTSASEFRALVQELTGQDAELPPDPSRFQDPSGGAGDGDGDGDGGHQTDSENAVTKIGHENDHTLVMPHHVDPNNNNTCNSEGQVGIGSVGRFEPFDDVFTPQMIDNISAFLPAFYESAQVDQMLMTTNLDAV